MGNLRFTKDEIDYLRSAVSYLPKEYFEYLADFKLSPETQVSVDLNKETGHLDFHIKGPWVETILYEIPILALVSEGYFKFVDKDWTYEGQLEKAAHKATSLFAHNCHFSEFGTRRRRSFKTQDIVIQGLVKAATTEDGKLNPLLLGTSNVLLAKHYNLKPIGTVAHEWMMGIAAYTQDYIHANKASMDYWINTMGKDAAGFALTDTFGTDDFLKSFKPPYTDAYKGVRQDSGDPLEFTRLVSKHYKSLGYPPNTKAIIYSDSLDVEKCVKYKKEAEENGLVPSFGVGTFFTSKYILFIFTLYN